MDGSVDPVVASVEAYSRPAADYESAHALKMGPAATRFAESLATPSLILDAGCGPGRDLARFVAHGHVARGVDLNPVFVGMANAHAPTTRCDLREVGSRFPAATFDGIWACASLVHLAEAEAADVLRQFALLLRPGGRLYVCVKGAGATGWLDEPDGRRWYCVWEAATFSRTVAGAGFAVDQVDQDAFVEVWATRGR